MNITERFRLTIETTKEDTQKNQNMDSTNKKTISTHVLDTSVGRAASNVPITLYKLINNEWKQINKSTTDNDGRCMQLIHIDDFSSGCYKLRFDTLDYFNQSGRKTLYPFIEIVVNCENGQHYHIPLLLNPFGYSTYRGT